MSELSKVFAKGELPIGNIKLTCYVLEELPPVRLLLAQSFFEAFDRPIRGNNALTTTPAFMSDELAFMAENKGMAALTTPIEFMDGNTKRVGYKAELLPELCSLYLQARRDNKLNPKQKELAKKAEILLEAFAKVGIDALIDEATGYQANRDPDALRMLLGAYLEEGIRKWIKEFPDAFFTDLDTLYDNEKTKPQNRPAYYGHFINTYVYEPIEKGKINKELDKRYKADDKRHRKHSHLTENLGVKVLQNQIGKVMGLMEVSPNIKHFKHRFERLGQPMLFPYDD
jgi:hypothetical protein